ATRDADVEHPARACRGSRAVSGPGSEQLAAPEEERPGGAGLQQLAAREPVGPFGCPLHRSPLLVHVGHLRSLEPVLSPYCAYVKQPRRAARAASPATPRCAPVVRRGAAAG